MVEDDNKRRNVYRVEELDLDDFNGPVSDLKKLSEVLSEKYGEQANLEVRRHWDNTELVIKFHRPETDAEMRRRIKDAKKRKATKEKRAAAKRKRDLALLAKLKEEYENEEEG